jgi:SAM-dependent methyltransferase
VSEAIWNDVECGAYEADLPLWEQLAAENDGPILELGCGAGRVVMHLAGSTGKLVIGVDNDDALVAALWERAQGTSGDAEIGDVRGFDLHFEFQLVLAPMQLIQLLEGRADRICCLSCVADHLLPGGRAAFAIVEEMPPPLADAGPQLPDVRQLDGWVYSSLPLEPEIRQDSIVLRRLRQIVSPEGDLSEEENEVVLQALNAEQIEDEAREMGLLPVGRRRIPATDAHVGSTVVVVEVE